MLTTKAALRLRVVALWSLLLFAWCAVGCGGNGASNLGGVDGGRAIEAGVADARGPAHDAGNTGDTGDAANAGDAGDAAPSSSPVVSLSIDPSTASIDVGGTVHLVVHAIHADGSSSAVQTPTWQSANPSAAAVDGTGTVIGVAPGHAVITATDAADGVSAICAVQVLPAGATLVSITVAPSTVTLAVGSTQSFSAVGVYSDGSTLDMTTGVTWSSSDVSRVTIAASGVATAAAPGSATVTAAAPGSGPTATASVVVTSPTLVSLALTPPVATIPIGSGQAFVAIGTYSDATVHDLTAAATWSVSSPSVASVVAPGQVHGLAAGTATVTATAPGSSISATATLTVSSATLQSIVVTPATLVLPAGSQQVLHANGSYSDGTSKDITATVTWSTSDSTIAVVASGSVTAIAAGGATITATDPTTGIAATASVTVTTATLASISIAPATASIPAGTTQAFFATGHYSNGSTLDVTASVTWVSLSPSVASVANGTSAGVATGLTVGSATIKAVDPNTQVSATAALTVTPGTLTSITIAPNPATVTKGATLQLKATASYSDGSTHDVTASVTWSSSAPSVASVSNATGTAGLATGLSAGSTTVNAVDPTTGTLASTTLSVTAATLVSVAVTPTTASVPAGKTQAFVATGTYSDGSKNPITSSVNWSSSDNTIAAVGADGTATAIATGTATVTATDPATGIKGTASLTVTAPVLTSIQVLALTLNVGQTVTLSATGYYSNSTNKNLSTTVTWSSSNTAVASVSGDTATGLDAGWTAITATDSATGISGFANFVVQAVLTGEDVAHDPLDNTGFGYGVAIATDGSNTPYLSFASFWVNGSFSNPVFHVWRRTGVSQYSHEIDLQGTNDLPAQHPSMATLAGSPCVAALTDANGLLYECRGTTGAWSAASLGPTTPIAYTYVMAPLSLAFDPTGNPYVVAAVSSSAPSPVIGYVHGSNLDTIEQTPIGWPLGVAFDGAAVPHVVYVVASTGALMHATLNGSTWVSDAVSSTAKVSECASLVFDPAGTLHVLYFDTSTSTLQLADRVNGAWSSNTVGGGQDSSCTMRVDGKGAIHVLAGLGYGKLIPGGPWAFTAIGTSTYADLAVDSTGHPHIAFADNGGVAYYHE
jgi:uncharacterized protein YjdB